MTHQWRDRVLETSTTTGGGDITLAGAVDRFRSFASVCGVGDTVYYFVDGPPGSGEYEVGLGTYSATNTLTRSTILDSSNGGSAVNFSAGTKRVGIGMPAVRQKRYEAGYPVVPLVSSLTWMNQGTSTGTDGTDALMMSPQVDGLLHSLIAAAPSAPFDIYARIDFQALSTAAVTAAIDCGIGIVLRDSSDNEVLAWLTGWQRVSGDEQNTPYLGLNRYTSSGSVYSATPILRYSYKPWPWLRLNVSSTTVTCYASPDGKNWVQIGTESIATFIDAVTHYGIGCYASSNVTDMRGFFSYFSTVAPF